MILPVISNSQCWWKIWSWYSKDKQWTLNICSNPVNLLVSANKDSPIATNPSPQTVVQHGTLYQPSKRSKMNQPFAVLPSAKFWEFVDISDDDHILSTPHFGGLHLVQTDKHQVLDSWCFQLPSSSVIPKLLFRGHQSSFQHEWHIIHVATFLSWHFHILCIQQTSKGLFSTSQISKHGGKLEHL